VGRVLVDVSGARMTGPPPIHFIIGAPRSGTTWLTRALNGHPAIYATENRLFGSFCELWPGPRGRLTPRITFDAYAAALARHRSLEPFGWERHEFITRFQREYHRFLLDFDRRHSGRSVIVDKVTPYLGTAELVVSQIRRFFPEAKVIHLLRDGRDVVTSGVFDWLGRSGIGTPRHAYFVEQRPGTVMNRFFDDDALRSWCRYWTEPLDAIERSTLDQIPVRYESMVADLPAELMRIFRHLGLPADETVARACAEGASFERLTGRPRGQEDPLAKIRRGIVGDWRNYFTRADGALFAELAGKHLIAAGYEPGHRWAGKLPESLRRQRAGCPRAAAGPSDDVKRDGQVTVAEPSSARPDPDAAQELERLRDVQRRQRETIDHLRQRLELMTTVTEAGCEDPRARWLYRNRAERMDATVPLFDQGRARFHSARYELACAHSSGRRVADIACGTGYGCRVLREQGAARFVVGVDICPESIEYARDVHGPSGVEYRCRSADSTDLETGSFDCVVSFETIEHVSDDRALLEEFRRLLRPDGLLVCSTPNAWPLDIAPHHVRVYDRASFLAALDPCFELVELLNQNSGTRFPYNRDQPAGIRPTTDANHELAECFIAVARRRG
jgi:2-polyprenyl-3-methyl-5-hydroxy-6-metoxy-1,4-benzoquinol methylase